ncbi:MAG: TIGR03087 family PEP-CTERM/XrtA system glycosyltransferase [Geminicoccaceae bacterium]
MAEILFVAHRVPYPPDKGDKIRAFNIIRHLSRHHRVHLAAFIDDPADIEPSGELNRWCASLHLSVMGRAAKLRRMATALLTRKALSVAVFEDPALRQWVRQRVEQGIDLAIGYSGAVAPLIDATPLIFDLVDCDSAKWQAMARDRGPLKGWIYRREAELVSGLERSIVARAAATILVSEPEAELCRKITGGSRQRIHAVANGVDTGMFDPDKPTSSPYGGEHRPVLVFTGVMNYPPNIEAMQWFHNRVWPILRRHPTRPRLAIVGSAPTAAIRAFADGDDVLVTGRVPEVQPWLAHATISIAPLQLARGIQNKVLEAMAMGLPVVATSAAAEGIDATTGEHLIIADDPEQFNTTIGNLLDDPERVKRMGRAARQRVIERHSWGASLARLDAIIDAIRSPGRGSPTAAKM